MSEPLRCLADDPGAKAAIPAVAPWIHEAGNPYLDWLLGGPRTARAAVERWMASERSEISIRRVTVLEREGRAIGGFAAIDGSALPACAKADSLAALALVGREGRGELLRRASALAGVRAPVEPDQWFLSKLGVLREHRRAGHGRTLLEAFLEAGERRGFRRWRVDARPEDAHVVGLYESAGFEVRAVRTSPEAGISVAEMVRQE